MTQNETIDKWHKKFLKLSMDHKRLMEELPADRHYHEGKSDLAGGLAVEFRVDFDKELKQYTDETDK